MSKARLTILNGICLVLLSGCGYDLKLQLTEKCDFDRISREECEERRARGGNPRDGVVRPDGEAR